MCSGTDISGIINIYDWIQGSLLWEEFMLDDIKLSKKSIFGGAMDPTREPTSFNKLIQHPTNFQIFILIPIVVV